MDHEILQELTENYLKSLISGAADTEVMFDAQTPFGEMGVNSFHVLKILKRLEQDFGTLPKTLLFENFNVRDLAQYFVKKHLDVLMQKFGGDPAGAPASQGARAEPSGIPAAVAAVPQPQAVPTIAPPEATPALVAHRHLDRYPALRQRREEIFHQYKNESSVSRGTLMIAPLLFFGDEKRGFFNCGKGKGILLAYGYTGPEDDFLPLAGQLFRYCARNDLQFNLFAEQPLPAIGDKTFTATPFGVMQRVVDLPSFTLEGQAMRRLRYQVSKFSKAGACRTEEYICGSDPRKAENIAAIIDQWCGSRTMVNPLIHIVKAEILAGTLDREHRIFLTYVDDAMQNVILISPVAAGGSGYLMDLEFYGADMPLGGLEFAIVNIIETLIAEGCGLFSLGGTYGVKLGDSPTADPEVEKILDELRQQNIFNDAGNLQFKNKFRPENKNIFLCRAADAGKADNVIDIIMMIADPSASQVDDAPMDDSSAGTASAGPAVAQHAATTTPARASTAALIEGNARSQALLEAGFNPQNLATDDVVFDLKTDSWAQLRMPAIDKQMSSLFAQLQRPIDVNASLRQVFPFEHFTLTQSGRAAEDIFCQAWEKKGRVPQNLLFPSTIFHQIDKGFAPQEMPTAAVFDLHSDEPYKGNLDMSALQAEVDRHAAEIAYVCIELTDNAAGGGAVSLPHLKQVKALLQQHRIPLVLDGTRVLENALLIIDNDPEWRDATLWQVATELLSQADAVVTSLAKDFCVNKGGMIATNDPALHERLQALQQREGKALDVIDKKCVALSLQNRKFIETQVRRRVDAVQSLRQSLIEGNVPVVRPARGHCLLIDVKQLPEFQGLASPVASFVAWLYLATGIRAGAHSVGMQQNSSLNQLVRLAIPVGLRSEDVEALRGSLIEAFANRVDIPDLCPIDSANDRIGDLGAKFRLDRYLFPSASAQPTAATRASADREPPREAKAAAVNTVANGGGGLARSGANRDLDRGTEIAIVGMAARFPKARNTEELWENLLQGRDCISEIPDSRYQRRRQRDVLGRYRGGFIDEIDRFDSLFFNISPREAETIDPQERLFLEVTWEALEDAGYYPEAFQSEDQGARHIGVFVGAVWTMYQMVGAEERLAGNKVIANSFMWSIANRVSYSMNFTGPSIAVDTACSASLTAIHLACDSIQLGECAAAIVGGVNLDVHQCKQEITVAGGLLSDDGFCRAFGRGASGYVPGEGVGALLLKPLSHAQRDNDNIYAVVKSTAISHGGRNSGYAVPNSKAQCDVVTSALNKAGIDARSIGYIEAHGTGTELGDPIEIAGLNQAFERDSVALQSCAIGSIKTNIGHLEAAAGIAGVCKVLLQMRHRQLVPSLHSQQINEFIDFAHSPFVVQQSVEPWQPKQVDGVRQPLRAGISSFGAGGSNAHVILEARDDAAATVAARPVQGGLRIFPLSARNEEQLRQVAVRLKSFIEKHRDSESAPHFDDIAFTLQVGRKSFDHRVAILADSMDQLLNKLQNFLGNTRDDHIVSGHMRNADGITKMLSRKEKEAFIDLLAQSRDPLKLAQLWIDGLVSDWHGMQATAGARRISLPTYPFADKRHWLESADMGELTSALAGRTAGHALHPLIDSNESTFERQLFRKLFTDQEFFIYDHLVSDIPTLPGVAYLDFARKAGEIAAGRKVQKIKNIIWVSPLTVQNAVPNEVFIELKPAGDAVFFEVFSEREGSRKQLYCQGKLHYASAQDGLAEDEYIDIEAIRGRCDKVLDGERAYPSFKTLGLDLGPTFQALQEVYRNPNVGFEVLGALKIPTLSGMRFEEFVLHPSLVDSSFQAAMGARLADAGGEMFVPYSLGEVEILHPLTPVCYSYITEAKEEKKTSSNLSKMNVLIVDEHGKVLVKVRDSVGVPLLDVHEKPGQSGPAKAPAAESTDVFSTLYFGTYWHVSTLTATAAGSAPQTVVLFAPDAASSDAYSAQLTARGDDKTVLVSVFPGDGFKQLGDRSYSVNAGEREDFVRLLTSLQGTCQTPLQVCFAWSALPVIADRGEPVVDLTVQALDRGVYAFLHLCQAIVGQKAENDVRLNYLYFSTPDESQPHNDAIQGFATILRAESPKLSCKIIEFLQPEPAFDAGVVAALANEFMHETKALGVRYHDGRRYLRRIESCPAPPAAVADVPIKHRGAYLITGGAGGLGLIFAEYLAKQFQARLILTGRSALKSDTEAALEALRQAGAEVLYVQADVAKREDIDNLVLTCKQRYGALNGIIHSAGVLRDSYIRNKTRDEMQAVFAPKILGTLLLDEATRNEPLDFFAMFSSLAALAGNAGQSDYSFANHFMDAFAAHRNAYADRGLRQGKALSVNWSIWAEGGMRLDEQTALFFERNLGIKPLEREVGIQALMLGLHGDLPHLAVVQGVKEKVERAWGIGAVDVEKPVDATPAAATSTSTAVAATAAVEGDDLALVAQNALSLIVMDFLKLDADDVDLDTILLDLGFDSIGLTSFSNVVNEKYGLDITPVLFFEYPNIREIAKYLAREHRDEIERVHGQSAASATAGPSAAPASGAAPIALEAPLAFKKKWSPDDAPETAGAPVARSGGSFSPGRRFIERPIAIVGMSGVMPQADNVDEFWEKLRNAENNMVTLVPADRWDWEECYGDPMVEKNKTLSKWGGFMREVDKFDPLFWGISPREAEMMDPQQRIFLETVWGAVEDSGHKVSDLAGTKTGLFVGAATRDYIDLMAMKQADLDGYSASGTSHAILVNRISFLLDLHGPSAPLDTACSSSLVALHRAIESIHTGSCEMAIVGGVQVMLTAAGHISFGAAGMLASDGKCKTFDSRANGYVRGEGSGAIFIKPLDKAMADGDHIYALIKSTAENHGGKATMLTAPNPNAQADLLVEAYEKAEIDPRSVGFLECHGTGTSLGDPIEFQAMKKAFSDLYRKHQLPVPTKPHIGLTSAKTNIGHLETAAGIAGILKVLLSIKHKQIPALLHFEKLNPYINLDNTPFYPVEKTKPWDVILDDNGTPYPRRAGISSFGFGGANVHIVLEEYPDTDATLRQSPKGPYLILVSAKHEDRLRANAERLLAHLDKEERINLADVAYTLQIGRDVMPERMGLIVDSKDELIDRLRAYVGGDAAGANVKLASVRRKADIGTTDAGTMKQWLRDRDLSSLLDVWLKGQEPDWKSMHAGQDVRRCSLPTYAFARERYWFNTSAQKQNAAAGTQATVHALLHRNVSVFGQQSFVSDLSGLEKPMRDAFVPSPAGLPELLSVEMARLAIQESLARESGPTRMELRSLNWEQDVPLSEGGRIKVNVYPLAGKAVDFEILSAGAGMDAQASELLVCEGTASYDTGEEPNRIDLFQLKKQFRDEGRDSTAFHDALARSGWTRERLPRGIEACHLGDSQQLLEFQLPARAGDADSTVRDELDSASLLSLAHLSCLSLMTDAFTTSSAATIVSLDRVQFFPGAGRKGSIWVRMARGAGGKDERLAMDVDIIDPDGRVMIRIKGLRFDCPAYADIQRMRNEEFEGLLGSIYESTGTFTTNEASQRSASFEFRDMLDEIY
ncbi:MAG: SDR family NAD(P)-dependent oxidoreductase [Lysobacter sp.]|nr:SDR family NAD(P)-dependent oxidoreductase [Lysobacter sp.]